MEGSASRSSGRAQGADGSTGRQDGEGSGGQKGSKGSGKLKDLATRIVSGAAYAVVFFVCLMWGEVPTAVFMAVESVLCCHEFFHMMRKSGKMPNAYIGLVAAAMFPLCALGASVWLIFQLFLLLVAVGIWYVYSPRARIEDVCITVFGPVYTGLMLSNVVLLRCYIPSWEGGLLCVGVVGSVMASDSLAYLVGGRFGSHKMAPKISPHKTWEGFFGGIVGCVLVWIILWAVQLYGLGPLYAILCGVVVSVFGVFGDLFESRIKRGVGVKDSGKLMPGHGGMLDRSDSLIFAGVAARFLLVVGGVI